MDIRSLTNDALKEIIHSLLDKGDARSIIDRHPLLAANVPMLTRARGAFAALAKSAVSSDPKLDAQLASNSEAIDSADGEFDHAARAGHGLLTTVAEVVEDEVLAKRVIEVRDALYPRGLVIVNLSAAESSGTARSLEETLSTLDSESEALLGKIKLEVDGEKFTALSLAKAQIAAGRKLGKLAAKREGLLAQKDAAGEPDEREDGPAFARYTAARNVIVKAVIDFRNDVDRADGLSDADKGALVGTIERLAKAKSAAKKAAAKPEAPKG
ncbi:MAG: hypothetical protein JNK05_33530 [Myxococcales bacterium]|nr:hypothetical protein [Myxococcales bacterium]